jgi:WD40 repeat protein
MSLSVTSPLSNFKSTISYIFQEPPPDFTCPPMDVLRSICSFLNDPKDVIHFGLANRSLSILCKDEELWNLLWHKHFPNSCVKPKSETEGLAGYQRLANVMRNVKAGKCQHQTFSMYQTEITCMKILNDKFICGTLDGTIKTWDFNTRQEPQMLGRHQGRINCMAIWYGKLISASNDFTIKIWDLDKGEKLQTLKGHQNKVSWITVWGDKLASGSCNGLIKIWDLNTWQELQELQGHQNTISCMVIWDNKLISSSYDQMIKIWDLDTGRTLQTLQEDDYVECITMYGDELVSGSEHSWISIWDPNTGKRLEKLKTSSCGLHDIMTWNGQLISISSDCMIKIWDPHTRQELWMKGQKDQSGINCMTILDDSKFATSFGDEISIWDFSSPHLNHSGVALKPSKKRALDDDKCASTSPKKRS